MNVQTALHRRMGYDEWLFEIVLTVYDLSDPAEVEGIIDKSLVEAKKQLMEKVGKKGG